MAVLHPLLQQKIKNPKVDTSTAHTKACITAHVALGSPGRGGSKDLSISVTTPEVGAAVSEEVKG